MADTNLPIPSGVPDGSGDATMLIDIEHELRRSYLGYAVSTLISRALPDVRDGFKPVQRRILYAMRGLGVGPGASRVKSARVVGECFVEGTLVSTSQGLAPIEQLEIGDMVYTQRGLRPVTQTYIMPSQPLLEVELTSGMKNVCTPGQQFKVLTSDLQMVWKKASELTPGEYIVSRSAPSERTEYACAHDIVFDEDMAYFLGFFLADGWVDRDAERGYDRLCFACADVEIVQKLQSILCRKFDQSSNITQQNGMYQLRVNNTLLNKRLLAAFGLQDKYARNITVPDVVFSSPASVKWAFLSGFTDGDGSVNRDDNTLVLTSISESFMRQIQTLLHSMDVLSTLYAYAPQEGRIGSKPVQGRYTTYTLEVRSTSFQTAATHLALAHPRKQARLHSHVGSSAFKAEKARLIPFLGKHIIAEFRVKHLGGGWYMGADGQKVRSGLKYTSGAKLRYHSDLADTFQVYSTTLPTLGVMQKLRAIGSDKAAFVEQLSAGGITFGQVKAVRDAGEAVTYDIQVEDEHEFVANGMLVHNCMGKYHPHGDAAIYGTLVRLAQDFSLRYPLIDPQGNFGCFTGDTKIKLLEGTEKTFAELAELDAQETFFVYSVDSQGSIVVGEGRNSRITRRAARLVKVTLDSGAEIRCTPDHRFMLRDGTYKEAQFLTPQDSLMPGYFDTKPVKEGLNEYLRVKQPSTGGYEFVHHIADAYNAERGTAPAFHGPYVRHHKNFNRFDNRPDNIERMEFLAHLHLHTEHIAELWQSEEFRQAQREGVQRYYETHPEVVEERRQRFIAQNQSEAFRQVNGKRVGTALKQRYTEDEEARALLSQRMKTLWADADYRAKMSEALSGLEKRALTPDEKARVAQIISEKSRAMWVDDAKRQTIIAAIISAMSSPELRATLSANAQRLWQDPEFRAKYAPDHFANMARTLWADPATRPMHRAKMIRQRQNPDFIEANKASIRRAYSRRLQANPQMMQDMAALSAQSLTRKWTDPEYKQRVIRQKVLRYVATLLTEHGSDDLTPQTYSQKRNANWIPRLNKALTYFDSFEEMVSAARNYNHRIVSVEWLEETADVYDITVDEHHNFLLADGVFVHNSVDGDPPAAQRYTECRMTPLAIEMLEDIERQTVDFMPNYDQSENEPVVLPGKFPNFLCNGGEGIAVGMSTSMPPHNLREVVDATLYFLDHPDATPDDLMKFVLAPDFPTAGLILGTKGAKEAYRTGRGRVIMQAQLQIEPMDNGKNAIVVTELPYQVNKAKLIEHIAGLAKEKRVDGITAINDFSDKHGMRVVIELRRDVLPKRIVNFLLKHSALRQTFGIIMLALVNGQPKMLNLAQIINLHVTHRREVITRRTRFELGNAKRRAHILEGMQIALDFLDEIIRLIRAAPSSEGARVEMVTRFGLTQLQAEAILNMQLRQIAQLERQKTEDEYRGLLREIARLEDILVTPARLTRMIKDELKGLRDKYGDDRRTRILPLEADQITEEDLIPEEKTLVTISRDGYIKRVPMDTYRTQKRGGKGVAAANLKEEDSLAHLFVATTTHMILFFTNRGRVYRLKAYEVPQTSRQARGQHINNFIGLEPGDQVTAILPMKNLMGEGYLFMATEYGEVKRTNLAEFANLRANGLNCFDLEEGDNLKWIKHTDGHQDALLVTRNGMSVRFGEGDVPTRGRAAGGVRGIEMRDPATRKMVDRVVTMDVVSPDTQLQLLVISENGLGKRTDLSKYNRQGRGGRGVKTMDVTTRTGPVIAAAVVGEDDKLMVISEKGVTIQTTIREIRETQSRKSQGVNVMNLGGGDRVVTIERLVDADVVAEEAEAAPDKDLQDVVVEPIVATINNGKGPNAEPGNGKSANGRGAKK